MTPPLVEQLDYAGSDPDSPGYIEALVIKTDGAEKYVLHRMYLHESGQDENGLPTNVDPVHEKIEFQTKQELINAFPFTPNSTFSKQKNWEKTNRACGYQIANTAFETAQRERYERESNER